MIDIPCACGVVLQVKEKYAGQRATCPRCGRRFSVPTLAEPTRTAPSVRTAASTQKKAQDRLMLPGLFLAIGAAFGVVLALGCVVFGASQTTQGPDERLAYAMAVVFYFVMFVVSMIVFVGAVQIMRARTYPLAVTAAILGIVPCIGPCFAITTLPFGIWALVVLMEPDVQAAFRRW